MSRFAHIKVAGTTALLLVLLAASACTGTQDQQPEPVTPGSSAGSRLAPGLYDQPDGSIVAIGTLEHRDLEGGFWAIVDGTQIENGTAAVVAVIANELDFESQLAALDGRDVEATGMPVEGASIRMAGPEIELQSLTDITDISGPAK